ncbi:hypothetical protein NDU88_002815 [Pleurodeles waltl]|uniref:Uncharacterized protein n=1 Tax=Pleurodeles waltl TaxID=8319 RepID=A0AAV7VFN5_PLEWA|nr:hypothetical protein NDU88_002815 [Pleurodeles waltl]
MYADECPGSTTDKEHLGVVKTACSNDRYETKAGRRTMVSKEETQMVENFKKREAVVESKEHGAQRTRRSGEDQNRPL